MTKTTFPGRVIIHVGDHKAGSTSIQSGLTRGDVNLNNGKLCYPLPSGRYGHNYAAHKFTGSISQRWSPDTAPLVKMAKLARSCSPDLTIFSAEGFEAANPYKVRRAFERDLLIPADKIDVFCLLRPHNARLCATLAEHIKCGSASPDPMKDLNRLRRYWVGYAARCLIWSAAFGDRYRVSPFLRSEMANENPLSEMFARTIGLDVVTIHAQTHANKSLSTEDLMRIHFIQQGLRDLPKWDRHKIGWSIARRFQNDSSLGRTRTPLALDKKTAVSLKRRYWLDATLLDHRYFDGRPLMRDALSRSADEAPNVRLALDPEIWLGTEERLKMQKITLEMRALTKSVGWRQVIRKQEIESILAHIET